MRKHLTLSALLILAGCSGVPGTIQFPTTPQPADIQSQANAIQAVTNLTPMQYLTVGMSVVDQLCSASLDKAAQAQDQLRYIGQTGNLAGGLATGLLALTAANPAAATGVGLGTIAFNQAIANQEQVSSPLGQYVDAGGALIAKSQQAIAQALVPPADLFQAQMELAAYAKPCTYSGVHALVGQAISAAQPVASGGSTPVIPTPSPVGGTRGVAVFPRNNGILVNPVVHIGQ